VDEIVWKVSWYGPGKIKRPEDVSGIGKSIPKKPENGDC
jgi:hypothetical protein